MFFCPRPSCQKAYDYSCLEKTGYIDSLDKKTGHSTRHIQLERSLPFVPVVETRESIIRVAESKDEVKGSHRCSLEGRYDQMPPELLALARSPMAKGKMVRAGGVVGNIPFVYRARQIVYDFLKNGKPLPVDLKVAIGLHDTQKIEDFVVEDRQLVCPQCGGAI